MSFVIAVPEFVSDAASDLANLGSSIKAANAAAAAQTTSVLTAGADEVSHAVATLFGEYAQAYQQVGTQAAAFHSQFVQAMSTAAGAYVAAEAANVSALLGPGPLAAAASATPAANAAASFASTATQWLNDGVFGASQAFGNVVKLAPMALFELVDLLGIVNPTNWLDLQSYLFNLQVLANFLGQIGLGISSVVEIIGAATILPFAAVADLVQAAFAPLLPH